MEQRSRIDAELGSSTEDPTASEFLPGAPIGSAPRAALAMIPDMLLCPVCGRQLLAYVNEQLELIGGYYCDSCRADRDEGLTREDVDAMKQRAQPADLSLPGPAEPPPPPPQSFAEAVTDELRDLYDDLAGKEPAALDMTPTEYERERDAEVAAQYAGNDDAQ